MYKVPIKNGFVQIPIPIHSKDLNPFTFKFNIVGRLGKEGKQLFWDTYFGQEDIAATEGIAMPVTEEE